MKNKKITHKPFFKYYIQINYYINYFSILQLQHKLFILLKKIHINYLYYEKKKLHINDLLILQLLHKLFILIIYS